MKNSILNKLLLISFFFFLFSFFFSNSFSYLDPDLGWHLKAGEFILDNFQVPRDEINDYTLEGKTWVDHEWLANFASFVIYKNLGYIVLNVLFAVVVLLIVVLLNIFLIKKFVKEKAQIIFLIFLEIVGFLGCLPHLGVRIQEFTILFWVLLFIFIQNYTLFKKKAYLFLLPLLFYVWANIHAGFLLGLFVFWVFCIYQLILPRIILLLSRVRTLDKFYFEILDKKEKTYLFISVLASTLITCLTPYFFSYYEFLFKYSNTFYLTHIVEWLPAWSAPILYYQLAYLVLFSACLILFLVDQKKKTANFWYFGLALFMFVLAFKSKRHFPLFFVASLPFLIETSLSSWLSWQTDLKFFQDNKILKIFVSACLAVTGVYLVLTANFTNTPFTSRKYCDSFPCAVTKFLKDNPDIAKEKIFNPYNWGGYFIFELPDKKLFIDGRLPMYDFNGHSLMEEYYEFYEEGEAEKKLDQYQINLVLLQKQKETKFNWFEKYLLGWKEEKGVDNLLEYLKQSKRWKQVYEDDESFLFLRNKYGL